MNGDDIAERKARKRGRAARREAFAAARRGFFDAEELAAAIAQFLSTAAATPARSHVRRWVPIGPAVARTSTTGNYVRSTGRVRDIAVADDGRRAYAGTGKGGLWYTDDAGSLWRPVGDGAARSAGPGGLISSNACGSLLVHFGASAADDFVMVGTGEAMGFSRPSRPALDGIGVLSARGPVTGTAWETSPGSALMKGATVFRLARKPGTTPGGSDDRVLAATTGGLFLGTRTGTGFTWTAKPLPTPFFSRADLIVTDVLWLPATAAGLPGRIVIAVAEGMEEPTTPAPLGSGVAYSDDLGATFHWVTGLAAATVHPAIPGRLSLAAAENTRLYVLGNVIPSAGAARVDTVWRIPDVNAATPAAATLTGVPQVWMAYGSSTQRDYDQALAVDVIAGTPAVDRIYLGGNIAPGSSRTSPDPFVASLWCLDVSGGALVPVTGISPPAAGQRPAGLIGDNVHADVHCVRTVPGDTASGPRQVWVGCDGGVYVSTLGGTANTFGPRVTGLAAFEANFVAVHPSSSHFTAIGAQDNGRLVRTGDAVWDATFDGDGGGVVFHPHHSQYLLGQYTFGAWDAQPIAGYQDPMSRFFSPMMASAHRESGASAFYSGTAAVRRNATSARIALGTNRIWVTDDLAAMPHNTWRTMPFRPGTAAAAVDARPGGSDSNQAFGVPGGGTLGPITGGSGPLGPVFTVKWAGPTQLLALFRNGIVRWTQHSGGQWTADVLLDPSPLPPAPTPAVSRLDVSATTLTDIAPIPGSQDFLVTTTGDAATPAGDTCFRFDDATRTFVPTTLRTALPPQGTATVGPLDPAQAVVVDPADTSHVYVGTVGGVWHGTRAGAAYSWTMMVNDLPQALVQDLAIWSDPAGGGPRLLRAALQSRGLWEVDLAAAQEPTRTYLRVHAFDDRRRLATPLANPRISPTLPGRPTFASPDITVRPAPGPATAPAWQFGPGIIGANTIEQAVHHIPRYELWTFQTAFRWHYPSVTADGRWNDAMAELVRLHRNSLGLGDLPRIHRQLWDAVVGGTRLTATGTISTVATDPLAVYRAPWQSRAALDAVATELDLVEHVHPARSINDVWRVYREQSMVDVLVHHRDAQPLPASSASVLLLWRTAPTQAALLATDLATLPAYAASVIAGTPGTAPTGWTVQTATGGGAAHTLAVEVGARMPRAVSIPVNLSTVTPGHFALFLAVAWSTADPCTAAPSPPLSATATPGELVQRWPYAALRLVRVLNRP